MTCADLVQSGDRSQRWLSVPGSRLVINPYDFDANSPEVTHSGASDSSGLPLNIGYLDPYIHDARGRGLYSAALLLEDTGAGDAAVETLWSANFEDAKKWSHSGGNNTAVEVADEKLSLTVKSGAPEPWQYASQTLRLDNITSGTVITVKIDACEGTWALKLNDGKGDDIKIQGDTDKTGTFTYNLADFISGNKPFRGTVKLYSIGYDKKLTVSRLDVRELSYIFAGAEKYNVSWAPQALSGSATYKNGLALEYKDFFIDERTIARRIEVKSGGKLAIGGALYKGAIKVDGDAITVWNEKYAYSFAVQSAVKTSFYTDITTMYANQPCEPADASAYIMNYGGVKTGDVIVFAFTLTTDKIGGDILTQSARDAANSDVAGKALAAQEQYWNDYLAKIPTADEFKFEYVDAKGVSSEQLRKLYCIAWVFAAQNLLCENPELGFNYKQVCCGKPSMWGYGEERSSYSASWESFFGMQLLAYTMPDEAWSAFTGMMSLVGADGMLGGESLPSEKAHTAWVLYMLTGDKPKLEAVYNNIARYLDWRIKNPRWIFLEHNDPNSADADFAESALIDIKYMMKITEVVKPDDTAVWQKKYDALLENYKKWFFAPDGKTYQYCDKINLTRSKGNTIWVTKGFYIPELTGEFEDKLAERFNTEYKKDAPFCGFFAVKYPDTSHTIYGLLNRGETFKKQAGALIETCARDVARVGMFAENYTNDAMPLPTGVRPSLFGCAMLIDSMLLKSGVSYNFKITAN